MSPHRGTTCAALAGLLLLGAALAGCGTTRWTDTGRTATEQLLISDAVDRSVSEIDFSSLRGQAVFFDSAFLKGVTDEMYVVSTLRQHLFASGCILKEKREEATYIVEARSGAVGTDRADVLYGLPATTIPQMVMMPGVPTAIPEIALGRKTEQHGVAKLAVFVYHRETGRAVWQSGTSNVVSHAKNIWVLGIGPIRRGTIYSRPQFVGGDAASSWLTDDTTKGRHDTPVRVAQQRNFSEIPAPNQPVDTNTATEEQGPAETARAAYRDTSGPPMAQPSPHRWSDDLQRLPEERPERFAAPPRYRY